MLQTVHCQARGFFQGHEKRLNFCGYKALSDDGDRIGTIHDYVVDERGVIRYLAVDSGFWIFGKKILVPAGIAEIDDEAETVTLTGLTKQMVDSLPAFNEKEPITEDFERELLENYFPGQLPQEEETAFIILYEEMPVFQLPERLLALQQALNAGGIGSGAVVQETLIIGELASDEGENRP